MGLVFFSWLGDKPILGQIDDKGRVLPLHAEGNVLIFDSLVVSSNEGNPSMKMIVSKH